MSQSNNSQTADIAEQDPQPTRDANYALDTFIFILKTLLIAAGVFGLAYILVSVQF